MQIIIYLMPAEVCSNGVGGYFKLGGEKFEQGTVKTRWIWGILPQENFEKVEANATLKLSNLYHKMFQGKQFGSFTCSVSVV
jgi:hypothetical protein